MNQAQADEQQARAAAATTLATLKAKKMAASLDAAHAAEAKMAKQAADMKAAAELKASRAKDAMAKYGGGDGLFDWPCFVLCCIELFCFLFCFLFLFCVFFFCTARQTCFCILECFLCFIDIMIGCA